MSVYRFTVFFSIDDPEPNMFKDYPTLEAAQQVPMELDFKIYRYRIEKVELKDKEILSRKTISEGMTEEFLQQYHEEIIEEYPPYSR